jgi:RNA polymerase sigma-70 factor (ECF subfamily)
MRARRGDGDAIAVIFEDHWPALWRIAFALTRRRELASDIAQEAFVRALERLDRFDEQRPLRPWLAKITVNLTVDHLRNERRLAPADGSNHPRR